eukprot:7788790-Alexandrium_andersonii.AAC.1
MPRRSASGMAASRHGQPRSPTNRRTSSAWLACWKAQLSLRHRPLCQSAQTLPIPCPPRCTCWPRALAARGPRLEDEAPP